MPCHHHECDGWVIVSDSEDCPHVRPIAWWECLDLDAIDHPQEGRSIDTDSSPA